MVARLAGLAVWGVVALLALIVAVPAWWLLLDPIDPIERDRLVAVRLVRSDDTGFAVAIEREVCSSRTAEVEVRTRLVGPLLIALSDFDTQFAEGCHTRARLRDLPRLPDGAYTWETSVTACNPLRCVSHPLAYFGLTAQGGVVVVERLPPGTRPETGDRPIHGSLR